MHINALKQTIVTSDRGHAFNRAAYRTCSPKNKRKRNPPLCSDTFIFLQQANTRRQDGLTCPKRKGKLGPSEEGLFLTAVLCQ